MASEIWEHAYFNLLEDITGQNEETPLHKLLCRVLRYESPNVESEELLEGLADHLQDLLSRRCTAQGLVMASAAQFLIFALSPGTLQRLAGDCVVEIGNVVKNMLSFDQHAISLSVHMNEAQAHDKILKEALHMRYPMLRADGLVTITSRPMFYGTSSIKLFANSTSPKDISNEKRRFAWDLLQCMSSFKTIPSRVQEDAPFAQQEMDLDSLQNEIARDTERNNLPCIVFANFSDDLESLRKICDTHSLWLHVEGDSTDLLLASATKVPKCIENALMFADSLICRPVEWFHAPASKTKIGSSVCLSFARIDHVQSPNVPLSTCEFVNIFPLWCQLRDLQPNQISQTADMCLDLCRGLRNGLQSFPEIMSVDLSAERFSPSLVYFSIVPNMNLAEFNLDNSTFHQLLYETLCNYSNSIDLLNIDYNTQNNSFCFRPVDLLNLYEVNSENITAFVEEIAACVTTLKEALELRPYFKSIISQLPDIQWVETQTVQSFVGLGAFHMIPAVLQKNADTKSIRSLNEELSSVLKGEIGCITTAESDVGRVLCIGAAEGLRNKEDVNEIFKIIQEKTAEIEFPEEVIKKMGRAISYGIQAAERHLEESQSDYHPDNLVRAVPVLGSLYSWIVPSPRNGSNIEMGHTFDIATHTLQKPVVRVIETDEAPPRPATVKKNSASVKEKVSSPSEIITESFQEGPDKQPITEPKVSSENETRAETLQEEPDKDPIPEPKKEESQV